MVCRCCPNSKQGSSIKVNIKADLVLFFMDRLFWKNIFIRKNTIQPKGNNYRLDHRTTILIIIPEFFWGSPGLRLEETRQMIGLGEFKPV